MKLSEHFFWFLSKNVLFLEINFSIYRYVFVMSDVYCSHSELMFKYNVRFETLLEEGISKH